MWVSFMIPKIEDGNNFGVSIQEDTLAEIQSVESEAAAFFDQISRYYVSRAKLISKVVLSSLTVLFQLDMLFKRKLILDLLFFRWLSTLILKITGDQFRKWMKRNI